MENHLREDEKVFKSGVSNQFVGAYNPPRILRHESTFINSESLHNLCAIPNQRNIYKNGKDSLLEKL